MHIGCPAVYGPPTSGYWLVHHCGSPERRLEMDNNEINFVQNAGQYLAKIIDIDTNSLRRSQPFIHRPTAQLGKTHPWWRPSISTSMVGAKNTKTSFACDSSLGEQVTKSQGELGLAQRVLTSCKFWHPSFGHILPSEVQSRRLES